MLLTASRRTDLPAFYSRWFINRVRAGWCAVPNPFNPAQVSRVSLHPAEVEMLIFVTRNPRPLFPYLRELDERGLRYYFQYTLMANPRAIDPHSPPAPAAVETFRRLAELVGPEKLIWRYDPIVFSQATPPAFHRDTYGRLAEALHGSASRSVVSVMDVYAKARQRLAGMAQDGAALTPVDPRTEAFERLMRGLAETAAANGMEIVSCAEEIDLQPFGIRPGKCVDDGFIQKVFGLDVHQRKDGGQRQTCGCVQARDIGMYDACLFGCRYCYATRSFELARQNHAAHNPGSPSLLGWHEPTGGAARQPRLF